MQSSKECEKGPKKKQKKKAKHQAMGSWWETTIAVG